MDCLEHIIQVTWRHRVLFVSRVFDRANRVLREVLAGDAGGWRPQALVVLDAGLAASRPALVGEVTAWFAAHADAVEPVSPPLLLEGGERVKNSTEGVQRVLAAIDRHHVDRHSIVIAVGGGGLLDVVGLAAALAHRGCRHVRIPTTTLSQCDSGVGVKNGINAFGKKNFVGTFSPPFAVLNDFDLLTSLPPREMRAGFVEAVKVACIRDRGFFDEIEQDAGRLREFEPTAMRSLIRRCAELHLNHIVLGGDPFECGSARPLDFGHWAAHKLEQVSDFSISHGEAVAVGIALDVIYSRNAGFLDAESTGRILALLDRLGFRLFARELTQMDSSGGLAVLAGLDEFREHLGGRLAITLLRAIGEGFEVNEMQGALVEAAIEELAKR
jgi:3-dehydroquinate synthase